jgi:dihydrodipicolinate synthase/N-acetylneuraminate lyase
MMSLGAKGVISVAANIVRCHDRNDRACRLATWRAAPRSSSNLLTLIQLFIEVIPILSMRNESHGHDVGETLLPLCEMDPSQSG